MELDPRISASRLRVSRRRALGIGGTIGFAGVLAACATGTPTSTATTTTAADTAAAPVADDELLALLAQAPRCAMTTEETQGPYWFDVDSIRQDIREDRPGLQLDLALRVQDLAQCNAAPAAGGVANAVVEIWHCDAGGEYSGFVSQAAEGQGDSGPGGGGGSGGPAGAPPGGGPGGNSAGGAQSDGSYSAGDSEASTSDDATFLRGAQPTDADGIVRFTTIFPGWYQGRAVHIHIKVHIDKKTVLTTQLYFDDGFTDGIYAATDPYSARARDTRNSSDGIYDPTGLSATALRSERALAALNLGINV